MALEMRVECGQCRTALAPDGEVYICMYECTFCRDCTQAMRHACPNCGGELVRRPRPKPQPARSSGQAVA